MSKLFERTTKILTTNDRWKNVECQHPYLSMFANVYFFTINAFLNNVYWQWPVNNSAQ